MNEGSTDLLLGREIFKVGRLFIPLNDFWVLKREGKLDVVVNPPNA